MSWKAERLDNLCTIQSGGTPPRGISRYYGGSVPWAKIGDMESADGVAVETEECITEEGLSAIGNRLFPKGTVLLAMYGSVGKVAVAGVEMTTNQAILGIEVTDTKRLDCGYLRRWLSSVRSTLERDARGVTQKNISATLVRSLEIPLPPLPEQRRIAAILDQADALRAKRREALAQLDSLTQSIFIEMFGDPASNPLGIRKTSLGSLANIATGSTPGREVQEHFGGNIPWVKTTEVRGEPIHDTEEHLTDLGLRAIRGKLHPAGSIVVAMYGQGQTRGRSGLLAIPASCNQACGVIHPSDHFDSLFMFCQLRQAYEQLRALGRGGNQENLNLQILGAFEVLLPTRALQQTFATRIQAVEALKATHRAALSELDALFASLQHRAFAGQL